MTLITMTELKKDLKKYTHLAKQEDVYITKNGKPYVKIVDVARDKRGALRELAGCIRLEKSYEELMDERYASL
ncbi:MAG: type II toxin-antitoxin system prevent-host-death family antitoxin [Erysipelotrichaceae bacterium]|nr:type II toxin-antitoxin system prevent-host-death family antitoxin [Erysipelotrichaceae bacterium]